MTQISFTAVPAPRSPLRPRGLQHAVEAADNDWATIVGEPMAHVISFRTGQFDPRGEPENPFNPIAGHSALVWLREYVLADAYEPTEPDAEDWGWYIEVQDDDASYTVGSICFDEDEHPADGMFDWMIQVVKHRKPSEVLFRRNAMTSDDPVTRIIAEALDADPAFEQVSVEYGK